ncbi:beta strand repeat-containing protein [Bradyrhizobium erythrophlei]|nr:hypothetical protein [Bradyrhizobium erythrophlei]
MTIGLLSFASFASLGNNNRVTINALTGSGWANLAKGFSFNVPASIADSNGYPTSTPSSAISAQGSFPAAYYGQFVWSYSGAADTQWGGMPAIIYSGAQFVAGSGNVGGKGSTTTNTTIQAALGTNPRVVFKFGALVASVSGGNGSLVTITTTLNIAFGSGLDTGSQVSFSVGCSSNLVNGPNSDGSWTITNVSGTQFTLNGSTGVVNPTVTGTGGPSVQTEAALLNTGPTLSILNTGTLSGFTNLVVCTAANETAVLAGQINDPTLRDQYKYLMNHASAPMSQRGWLRFMDTSGVQGSYECDFANRMPASYICYNTTNYFPLAYQVGTITNTSDALTCADTSPVSVLSSGAYVDSAIVQGTVSAVNATANPTLAVGTGPAAPIFDFTSNPNLLIISAPAASAGLTMQWTFSASGWTLPQLFGGSTYTFSYTTSTNGPAGKDDTVSAANLCANLIVALSADATLAAAKIGFGNSGPAIQVYPRTAQAGALTIAYVPGPAICTVGRIAPGVPVTSATYTSATGHLVLNFSVGSLLWNIQNANPLQVSGLTGTGSVSSLNSQLNVISTTSNSVTLQAPSSLGTITINNNSGVIGDGVTTLTSGTAATFIYNKILGGWIYKAGGMVVSIPFEAIAELCNQVGAHCWYNWPVYTKAAFITSVTNFFGDATTGLTSGLRFGTEVGNELWNFSQGPFAKCLYLGFGIGIYTPVAGNSEAQQWSWGALRTIQYGNLSKTAWTGKGRSLSDHYILQMGAQKEAFTGSQNFTVNGLQGAVLTTSNPIYNSWSAFAGGLGVADYSTVGNRPIDGKDSNGAYVTATGHADYWYSDYLRETADNNQNTTIFGTVSDNATWLQASLDYTNGNTASAFSAMAAMFSTQRGSASIVSGSCSTNGKLTLTLSGPINITTQPTVGDVVYLFQLTGTGLSNVNTQGGFTTISPTSGTTATLNVPGLVSGSINITGGAMVDWTASTINPLQNANWVAFQFFWANFESVVGSFDGARTSNGLSVAGIMHYEGAPQWSVSNSAINGTNSTTATSDLVTQMTNLGWNVSAYGASVAVVAQQVLNLIQGWKLDTTNAGAAANTGSYKNMIKTNYYSALVAASAGKGREVKPAQYGYEANIWGLFPGVYSLGGQYTNYDAIHEWNQ